MNRNPETRARLVELEGQLDDAVELEAMGPGARISIELANRHAGCAGQEAGKGIAGKFEAMGIPVGPKSPLWVQQLAQGVAAWTTPTGPTNAVVQLPEPLRERIWPVVIGNETETVWVNPDRDVEYPIVVSGACSVDATEARNLAAALWAAAAKVEAGE